MLGRLGEQRRMARPLKFWLTPAFVDLLTCWPNISRLHQYFSSCSFASPFRFSVENVTCAFKSFRNPGQSRGRITSRKPHHATSGPIVLFMECQPSLCRQYSPGAVPYLCGSFLAEGEWAQASCWESFAPSDFQVHFQT